MAGSITFSGVGSGIDVDTIVKGLINADSVKLDSANTRIKATQAAVSDISGIGSLLKDLKNVVDSLDTATELSSYSGKSANDKALTVTTSSGAAAGTYDVRVVSLLKEQRTYSNSVTSKDQALGKEGTLRLSQNGVDYDVAIESGDTLENIAAKINESGAKIKANVFFDGSEYRLQLAGSEGGAQGAFAASEMGGVLGLGLEDAQNTRQNAADAEIVVDGISVKSKSNVITGAVAGVSFNLLDETSTSFKVQVAADPTKVTEKLKDFVTKYNAVVERIHRVSGFGDTKASNAALAGDSGLRAILNGLSSKMLSQSGASSSLKTLADVGLRLNNNGTIRLDESKMNDALTKDPDAFSKVLAGDVGQDGVMDLMGGMLKGFTDVGTGLLSGRTDALNTRLKVLKDTVLREQTRLDRMEERLRKTFGVMDASVAASNASLSFLYNMAG